MEKNKSSAPVYFANLISFCAIGFLNLAVVNTQSGSFFGVDINDIKTVILLALPSGGLIIGHYLGVLLTYVSTSRAERKLSQLNKKYKETCRKQLDDPLLSLEEKEKIKQEYAQLSADERALANSNYSAGRDRFKKADDELNRLRNESPENNTGLNDMMNSKE